MKLSDLMALHEDDLDGAFFDYHPQFQILGEFRGDWPEHPDEYEVTDIYPDTYQDAYDPWDSHPVVCVCVKPID